MTFAVRARQRLLFSHHPRSYDDRQNTGVRDRKFSREGASGVMAYHDNRSSQFSLSQHLTHVEES